MSVLEIIPELSFLVNTEAFIVPEKREGIRVKYRLFDIIER
jgi:hypothetical protein